MNQVSLLQIIWTDEKKFNLDGCDGNKSYWHDIRKDRQFLSRRNFGGGGVMVWASFTSTGRVKLAFVPKKMKSKGYQFVLRRCLLPFFRRNRNKNFILMQDNAPIHASQSTQSWLQRKNIPLLEWPPNSPDLNPLENIWGIMVRRIYEGNRQYSNICELKKAIVHAWHSIDQKIIDNLVLSMDNRIFQATQRNGGPTDY